MKKNSVLSILVALIALPTSSAFAFDQPATSRYFNGPTVSEITTTSATVSLGDQIPLDISDEERGFVYFEYSETNKVCIAIYPTPESCMPKRTEMGASKVTLTNLTPGTSYTVVYKKDNTIRCITTPCPQNGYQSLSATFTTKKIEQEQRARLLKNIGTGSQGSDVRTLQSMLVDLGYLKSSVTGYFGPATFKAVKQFQKDNGINSTGFVGSVTRQKLAEGIDVQGNSRFEGVVTGYSTLCFADGECSIMVDGKKIVTTIGWSQATVGRVIGLLDFGDIERKIGARAIVHAKKTTDGYTLYGDAGYFIKIQ